MRTSSRELVEQTLGFESPPRVPRQLWLLPWAQLHHREMVDTIKERFPDDLVHAPAALTTPLRTKGDPYAIGQYVDEWGCVFENLQAGLIGEVKQPLVESWDDLDSVRIPKERLCLDKAEIDRFCRQSEQFVITPCFPRPFEQLQFIRGPENLYYDLADEPDGLRQLQGDMHAFYVEELSRWAETEVDALMFMDDWGSQSSTLISPAMWRRLFKPLYKDYIDIAHAAGKYAFMHSDGHILGILPDLVELGLDALNSQVACMGLDELGARFAGQITFWGELDRQQLLPNASREEIVAEARQMKERLYRNGGLIAQCEFGPGARPENVYAFFEAWEEL